MPLQFVRYNPKNCPNESNKYMLACIYTMQKKRCPLDNLTVSRSFCAKIDTIHLKPKLLLYSYLLK